MAHCNAVHSSESLYQPVGCERSLNKAGGLPNRYCSLGIG